LSHLILPPALAIFTPAADDIIAFATPLHHAAIDVAAD
jgi:hypothetical protein